MKRRETIKVEETLVYTAVIEPAAEGGYTVSFPAVPNLATEGDTLEEARRMARECLQSHLEVLRDLGHKLPRPDGAIGSRLKEPVEIKLKTA